MGVALFFVLYEQNIPLQFVLLFRLHRLIIGYY